MTVHICCDTRFACSQLLDRKPHENCYLYLPSCVCVVECSDVYSNLICSCLDAQVYGERNGSENGGSEFPADKNKSTS